MYVMYVMYVTYVCNACMESMYVCMYVCLRWANPANRYAWRPKLFRTKKWFSKVVDKKMWLHKVVVHKRVVVKRKKRLPCTSNWKVTVVESVVVVPLKSSVTTKKGFWFVLVSLVLLRIFVYWMIDEERETLEVI